MAPERLRGHHRSMTMSQSLPMMFRPLLAMFGLCAVVVAVAVAGVPQPIDDILRFGSASPSDSMHRAKWYAPAVEDLWDEKGRAARIAQVDVYEDRIA